MTSHIALLPRAGSVRFAAPTPVPRDPGGEGAMTGSGRPADGGTAGGAYEERFGALWQRAYVVAYRVLGSRPAAEDIAQETLARAYSWWSRIARSPSGWVAKVAYGLAIDQVRRQKVARLVLERDVADSGPELRIEDRMDLMAAIERLPRRQRQVVVLRYLADQSEADTAEALGVKITTVREHAARALGALGGRLVAGLREG